MLVGAQSRYCVRLSEEAVSSLVTHITAGGCFLPYEGFFSILDRKMKNSEYVLPLLKFLSENSLIDSIRTIANVLKK